MLSTKEQEFVYLLLQNPPTQTVEEVASDVHETNRIPDPHVYFIGKNKLLTPNHIPVENYMDKTSSLGKVEYHAFAAIQNWATNNESGTTVWFSPPFEGYYPFSKIIISEICNWGGIKALFNRAVVLNNVDADDLVNLANKLRKTDFENPEILRAFPLFPTVREFSFWFDKLSKITNQAELIQAGFDVEKKTETLATVADIEKTVHIAGENSYYARLYEETQQKGLIGKHPGSCPSLTPFQHTFEQSLIIKIVECTCPNCHQKVDAEVYGGRIHCPNCHSSATYHC